MRYIIAHNAIEMISQKQLSGSNDFIAIDNNTINSDARKGGSTLPNNFKGAIPIIKYKRNKSTITAWKRANALVVYNTSYPYRIAIKIAGNKKDKCKHCDNKDNWGFPFDL